MGATFEKLSSRISLIHSPSSEDRSRKRRKEERKKALLSSPLFSKRGGGIESDPKNSVNSYAPRHLGLSSTEE